VSYSVDANVLLYASDASSPFHGESRAFLDCCVQRAEIFCLGWITIMAYLRISTHPSIFAAPLSPEEARQNVAQLLSLPQVRVIAEEEGFWNIYLEATRGISVRGNLVPDSHLAALLKQHDVKTLYTLDADFRRFSFLDVRNPLSAA
jgi:toxin-antitoxin system PIN domain toxin